MDLIRKGLKKERWEVRKLGLVGTTKEQVGKGAKIEKEKGSEKK